MEHRECTSLQTIVTDQGKEIRFQQLTELFRQKAYQPLCLPALGARSALHQHPLYRYFCSVLQQWNGRIDLARLPPCSDTDYHRHLFIHDRLKSAASHSPDGADRILRQLEQWHSRDRRQSIKYLPTKPQPATGDEEWQLRKTFKSNLPAEIGGYRRKVFNTAVEAEKGNTAQLIPIDRWRKVKTEAYCDVDLEEAFSSERLFMLKNKRIRTEREKIEFSSLERSWKLKKSRAEELGIKSYYEGHFPTGKLMSIGEQFRKGRKVDDLGLPKRARSSFDLSKEVSTPAVNQLSQKDLNASAGLIGKSKKDISERGFPSTTQLSSKKQNQTTVKLIDGMRLMVNPFETSLKKKKRNT